MNRLFIATIQVAILADNTGQAEDALAETMRSITCEGDVLIDWQYLPTPGGNYPPPTDTGKTVDLAEYTEGDAFASQVPTCIHCRQPLTRNGGEWVDPTGGDVCGWDGGNESHEVPANA